MTPLCFVGLLFALLLALAAYYAGYLHGHANASDDAGL